MSPEDARLQLLRAEVTRDWEQVEQCRADACSVAPSAGRHQAAFVALALDHGYQAFESLLLRLERGLGLPARSGDAWHRALLADAARPIEGLRPAVIPAQAEADWARLLAFRHFLRHAYAVELDAEKLEETMRHFEQAVLATGRTIQDLRNALR